ncbi:hypothetical protein N9052_01535 [bacterium]|nr:hypothetical protein [bacterium]
MMTSGIRVVRKINSHYRQNSAMVFFTVRRISFVMFLVLGGAMPAAAYVGPGLGAGTLGVIVGLVGSILLALFAFFWYPIKRILFSRKRAEEDDSSIEKSTVEGDVPTDSGSSRDD